jgi:ABC-type multidrug transport system fused ATPase/permease subunit
LIGHLLKRLLADLWLRFGWRCPTLVGLIVMGSFLEGLAISLLLPLLAALGIAGGAGGPLPVFGAIFHWLGLPVTVLSVALLMGVMVVFQYATLLLQAWLSAVVQSDYLRQLRQELFRRLMRADWPFLMKRSAGSLINAVSSETSRAASGVYVIVQLASSMIATAIFVSIALALSWQLTIFLLISAGVVALVLHPIVQRARSLGAEISDQNARSLGWLGEVFNGAKLIKATAAEDHVAQRHDVIEGELARTQRSLLFQPHLLRSVFEATGILLLLTTLALAAGIFDLSGGVVITIVALFLRLYPRLGNIQHLVQQLFINLPAIEALEKLRKELDASEESTGIISTGPLPTGDIEIANLHLSYDRRPVLKGLDLRLANGGLFAFVGPSGAGKTSLVDCLLGLVPPTLGEIEIGQLPIAEIGLGVWRRSVGYVTQETILFNMSIRDNIAWSNAGATQSEIETAARSANAHDFIMETARGYDTPIGDRGVLLSGGQRQRLGLARALLGKRALLILDEATSALDSESEEEILKVIRALRGQITVIMIAHRLSTVRDCDAIFVLDKGRVVESGSWAELVAGTGRFNRLWEQQSASS